MTDQQPKSTEEPFFVIEKEELAAVQSMAIGLNHCSDLAGAIFREYNMKGQWEAGQKHFINLCKYLNEQLDIAKKTPAADELK